MNPSPIIYMDSTFMIEAYESSSKKLVPVKVVKTEDLSGGFFAGIFTVGASTKETKEFPFSSRRMYEKIKHQLSSFPTVDLENTESVTLPDYFWTEGNLCLGTFDAKTGEIITSRDTCFRLFPSVPKKGNKGLCLVTNNVYFSAGYDQVLQHARGAAYKFDIPVRALIKVLAHQATSVFGPLCTPLVIEKGSKK